MAKKANYDVYIVKSKVKERIAKAKCHTSSDVFHTLGGMLEWYMDQATKRAKANGRKTVRANDFIIM